MKTVVYGKKGIAEKFLGAVIAIGMIALLVLVMMMVLRNVEEDKKEGFSAEAKLLESQTFTNLLVKMPWDNQTFGEVLLDFMNNDDCDGFLDLSSEYFYEEVGFSLNNDVVFRINKVNDERFNCNKGYLRDSEFLIYAQPTYIQNPEGDDFYIRASLIKPEDDTVKIIGYLEEDPSYIARGSGPI